MAGISMIILAFLAAVLPAAAAQQHLQNASQSVNVSMLTEQSIMRHELELPPSDLFELPSPKSVIISEDQDIDLEELLPAAELPDSDIPLTLNAKVDYFITYFQTKGKGAFSKWLSRSERYIPTMKAILSKEGLPEDLVYLAMIESGFTPHAVSSANAVGPWQFISGTGKRYSLRIDKWIDERRDPIKSTVAAALYLKELYSLFNNDWYLAAAGYNAGENKILRAISRYNTRDFWEISKGSYLARETKEYVPKLLAAAIIAKEPTKFGFADIAYLPPVDFDLVNITSRTDLEIVARITESTYDTIRTLNPELRRWCTPPEYPSYQLKIPKGTKSKFEAQFSKIPENERFRERVQYARYKVKRRDTLVSVAKKFHTTPDNLKELNSLHSKSHIKGKTLIVPVELNGNETSTSSGMTASKTVFKKYYTVKKGDTLRSVARKFNVSEKLLASWNSIKGKIALKSGRRLIIAKFVEKKGGEVVIQDGRS